MSDANLTAADEPVPDLSGRQLGDYRLLRRLGRGAMADVYLAEQSSLGRQVAFKVLKPHLARDTTYVRRFHNEARSAAALVQANIVQIHEVGCIDGVHFIAQEYVAGLNLKQWIMRHGAVSADVAVRILRQVAAALHKAGQQGIIHRDIKPENIMLAASGEVKVADFGLARATGNGGVDLTQIGMTMGTPLYMSPEQIQGRALDHRSDIYSLGVTTYEMLAGRPPFEADTPLGVAVQHLNNQPESIGKTRDDLPDELCRVVDTMLQKDPAQRFQQAGDLIVALRGLVPEREGDAAASGIDTLGFGLSAAALSTQLEATQRLATVMAEAKPRSRRIWGWLWGVAAIVVVAAFGAGAAWAWFTAPKPLLTVDEAEARNRVKQMDSPEQQWMFASLAPSEAAWRAVWQYFPPEADPNNRYYANLAKRELGDFYLREKSYEKAKTVYEELAKLDSTEEQFRAYGHAGLALAHDGLNNRQQAAAQLVRVSDLERYLNQEMRERIETLRRKYEAQDPGAEGESSAATSASGA
jgi:serine/threonine-protein kinase